MAVASLVRRNLRLFFRDRMAVFFSFLAAIIVFALYTMFLGELQLSDLRESFPESTDRQLRAFVDSWMFAGVVSMTAITTCFGALGVFVDDAATGRFRDFLVSPLRADRLVLGYFFSALAVAMTTTLAVFILGVGYLWLVDGVLLSVTSIVAVVAISVLTAATFCSFAVCVTSFVASQAAFVALSTAVGTVLGFLSGAYIPVGAFSEPVRGVVMALPFGQASLLMRRAFASDALDGIAAGETGSREPLRAYYGLDASIGDLEITTPLVVVVLVVLTVLCALVGVARMRRRVQA